MENETAARVPSAPPAGSDLEKHYLALRKQVFALLILTIFVSGTFSVYLWRQGRQRHIELATFKTQIAPLFAEYGQLGPRMDEFVRRIIDYGNKNPDFGPIMVKYNLATNTVQVAPKAPAAAPAPKAAAPAATPKK